jgi:hypothetical protein
LPVDNRDAQFFFLRRIEKHAFHVILLPRSSAGVQGKPR